MTGVLRAGRALVVAALLTSLLAGVLTAVCAAPAAGAPVLHRKVLGYSG